MQKIDLDIKYYCQKVQQNLQSRATRLDKETVECIYVDVYKFAL